MALIPVTQYGAAFTSVETAALIQLADLGDPNANRILGWDDTDNSYAYFVIGSGLTYTQATHTLSSFSANVTIPTGTINGVNQVFTVTAKPLWVVSDGTTYFDANGYTYAALTITMDIPPSSYIRAII